MCFSLYEYIFLYCGVVSVITPSPCPIQCNAVLLVAVVQVYRCGDMLSRLSALATVKVWFQHMAEVKGLKHKDNDEQQIK